MSKIKDGPSAIKAEESAGNQERREFIKTSLSAAAVGGITAVGGMQVVGASSTTATSPNEPKTPELKSMESEIKIKRPYPMYTPRLGYEGGNLTWWKGRNVAGAAIGVLQFSANIPMMPGNIGNAGTFDFPVIYHLVEGLDIWALVEGRSSEEDLAKILDGVKSLESQGVRAIVANCGYWANYQREIAEVIDVPFVSSSLVQLPWLLNILKPSQKIIVLTLNVELMLKVPALESVGVTDLDRLIILPGDSSEQYQRVAAEAGDFDPVKFSDEIVQIVSTACNEHPEAGAILLECTELTAFAWAVQEAVGLPVFDSITPIKWMHSGVVQRPYYGHL